MQDTQDLVLEGFKMLGKTADAKKAEAEAAKAASEAVPPAKAVTPNQPVETAEPVETEAHEVETSEPWYHPHHLIHHAPTIVVAALGLIGMVAVAKINNRIKKKRRPT